MSPVPDMQDQSKTLYVDEVVKDSKAITRIRIVAAL